MDARCCFWLIVGHPTILSLKNCWIITVAYSSCSLFSSSDRQLRYHTLQPPVPKSCCEIFGINNWSRFLSFHCWSRRFCSIKWFFSLNTVQGNWNEMLLIFNLNGKRYKLQGVPRESNVQVAFQYFSMEANTSGYSIHIDIQRLLHKFESIFFRTQHLTTFSSTNPLYPFDS